MKNKAELEKQILILEKKVDKPFCTRVEYLLTISKIKKIKLRIKRIKYDSIFNQNIK